MSRLRGVSLVFLLLASGDAARAEPPAAARPAAPLRFQLFPSPPSLATVLPLTGVEGMKQESLLRLPGDADSLFTLGGPAPSGQPRVRLAVEVNEASLKLLAPDPKVESSDARGRPGGDWKPIDSAGRPYQLRFGARLIW